MSCPPEPPDRAAGPIIDPDVDLHDPAQRGPALPAVLAAIAAGGILGAEARYGLSRALPHRPDSFAWSTLLINLTGCLLIGVLMATLLQLPRPHSLARPFLGTGILGGYTTYSTFALDALQLVRAHRPGPAAGYLVATVLGCAVAVWLAATLTERAWQARRVPAESA